MLHRFGEKYASLKATILKKLCEAIGDDRPLTTIFGGLVGISMFGPKAVDAFVLPLAIHYGNAWAAALDKTSGLIPLLPHALRPSRTAVAAGWTHLRLLACVKL